MTRIFTQSALIAVTLPVLIFPGCGTGPDAEKEMAIDQRYETGTIEIDTVVDDVGNVKWNLEFLTGKFDPSTHPDFEEIKPEWASREGMVLHQEALKAYSRMRKEAEEVGIELIIRSATRNFQDQKRIWEEKWEGSRLSAGVNAKKTYPDPVDRAKNILLFSAMPGTSRHHWGTEVDLNSFDNSWFETGEGLELYNWLLENAGRFGFCQPYTEKGPERPTGYSEEKWHWSFVPLSKKMTKDAGILMTDEKISGFKGAETAREIAIIENYVLGINPGCLDELKLDEL